MNQNWTTFSLSCNPGKLRKSTGPLYTIVGNSPIVKWLFCPVNPFPWAGMWTVAVNRRSAQSTLMAVELGNGRAHGNSISRPSTQPDCIKPHANDFTEISSTVKLSQHLHYSCLWKNQPQGPLFRTRANFCRTKWAGIHSSIPIGRLPSIYF